MQNPILMGKGIGERSKLMLQCFKKAEIWHELCVYSPLMLWFAATEAGAKSQSSFAIRMLHTRVFFTQVLHLLLVLKYQHEMSWIEEKKARPGLEPATLWSKDSTYAIWAKISS